MLSLKKKKTIPQITINTQDLLLGVPMFKKHTIPYYLKCKYCTGIVTGSSGFVLYRKIPLPDPVVQALIRFSNVIDIQLKDTVFYFSMSNRKAIEKIVYKIKLNVLKKKNTKEVQKVTRDLPRLLYRILYPYKAGTSILYIDGAVFTDVADFSSLESNKVYISNNFSFYLYADSSYVYTILLSTKEQIDKMRLLLSNREVPLVYFTQ